MKLENLSQALLGLLALGAAFFIGWVVGSQALVARQAEATGFTHKTWNYYWGDWSECEPYAEAGTCGTYGGTQTRYQYRQCQFQLFGTAQCQLGNVQATGNSQTQECEIVLPPCEEPVVCLDEAALNYKEEAACEYPVPEPQPWQGAAAPICTDTAPGAPANPLIKRKGADAIAQWQPTGGNTANIYYHEVGNDSNAHALAGVTNDGYEDNLHLLGSTDWTFGIQQSNGCAGGPVVWIEDGNTSGWVLFRP